MYLCSSFRGHCDCIGRRRITLARLIRSHPQNRARLSQLSPQARRKSVEFALYIFSELSGSSNIGPDDRRM